MKEFHVSYSIKRRIVMGVSLIILVLLYMFKNFSFLIRSLSAIGLLFVFYLADYLFDVRFKKRHYFFILFTAITAFLLSPLYYVYPTYDKFQHLFLPAMFGSIVFHMMSKLEAELKWKLVFVFFIVMGMNGIFEIGEYLLDYLFDLKLQGVYIRDIQGIEKYNILQDKIDDTMVDMSFGVLSAAIYCFSVYIFYKLKRLRKTELVF